MRQDSTSDRYGVSAPFSSLKYWRMNMTGILMTISMATRRRVLTTSASGIQNPTNFQIHPRKPATSFSRFLDFSPSGEVGLVFPNAGQYTLSGDGSIFVESSPKGSGLSV